MRVDAHHHFWRLDRFHYPWITPDLTALKRDYLPEHLEPHLAKHQIDRSVLVQTISSVEETRYFLRLADEHSFIAGVVGWVHLTAPNVAAVLDELIAGPGRLVGVRHQVHDEPDASWLLREEVQRGLGELARRAIPYDLLIRPTHLDAALQTADALPELSLIVDHLAKPRIAGEDWDEPWARGIAALARRPNVACKLSGMITEAHWNTWTPADLRPYIDHVLDAFGPTRLMFGSDWPVCRLAGTYDQVIGALESNLASLADAERANIFGGTAGRVYRLEQTP